MEDTIIPVDPATPVITFDYNTSALEPRSSYLEHGGRFKAWSFRDNTLCWLMEYLRGHPETVVPHRLMTFLTANSLGSEIPEELRIQLAYRGLDYLHALQSSRQARIDAEYRRLMSILKRANRFFYQKYLNDGIHTLIEKLERCESYIELDMLFVHQMYLYVSYATNAQKKRAFLVVLSRASKFLAEKPRHDLYPKILARCIDLYWAVIEGQIPWPVAYIGPEWGTYTDPDHLGGYEWVQHFLHNIPPGWMIDRQFLFHETGRLAHSHLLLAQARAQTREMTRMLTRGTLRRDGNKSQLRCINNSLLRMIIVLAFPVLDSDETMVTIVKCEPTQPFNQD